MMSSAATDEAPAAPPVEPGARLRELIDLIRSADYAYYVLDAPIVSDSEYDAAMRELKLAGLAVRRAGECALLMSEEFGLEQVFRNRRAVDGDKRTVGSRTERVQSTSEQFLACSAFALEKHRRISAGCPLERDRHLFQTRIFADDLWRATPRG